MGLFADWVMMKAPREAVEARFASEGLRVAHEQDEWSFALTRGHDLGSLVDRLKRVSPEPVIAGWIYDSDFAYLTGAGPPAHSFSLMIGTPYGDAVDDEIDPALIRLVSGEGQDQSAKALAAWSRASAQPVSVADVLTVLQSDWTFAEEGVAALFEALKLPDPLRALEAETESNEAGVSISLSVHMLATLSASRLLRRLSDFSRPQGTAHDGKTIEIHLDEAATAGPRFDELVALVQGFVDEIGLPQLTIFAAGRAQIVKRQGPINLDR